MSRRLTSWTFLSILSIAVIAGGVIALLIVGPPAAAEKESPPEPRRDWPGAAEHRAAAVLPAEARLRDLGHQGVLDAYDRLMMGGPDWGKGAFVYFFPRWIDPPVALYESFRSLGMANDRRARRAIAGALRVCEKLCGLRGHDARRYLADYDKRRDGFKEWIVRPRNNYTAWRSPAFRAAIANPDATARAAWSISRLCALVKSEPVLRRAYGKRATAIARFLRRNVLRNPHYERGFRQGTRGVHVLSGQIAPRNSLTMLNLSLVLGDARLRRAGLSLAVRIRRGITRFSRQMPDNAILLTSLDCVVANTAPEAWAGLEAWGRMLTDGRGNNFCAPSDTSHLNAYITLLTACHRRRIALPRSFTTQALTTMRGMWISADQPLEAQERGGRKYLVSEQFSDYPGGRLLTVLADPHHPKSYNIPGYLGRNICPGWAGLVTMALDDKKLRDTATVQELREILIGMPIRCVSGSSTPTFLAYGYGLLGAPGQSSPAASPSPSPTSAD